MFTKQLSTKLSIKTATKFYITEGSLPKPFTRIIASKEYTSKISFDQKENALIMQAGLDKIQLDLLINQPDLSWQDKKNIKRIISEYNHNQKTLDINALHNSQKNINFIKQELESYCNLNKSNQNKSSQKRLARIQETLLLLSAETIAEQKLGIRSLIRIVPYFSYKQTKNIEHLLRLKDIFAASDRQLAKNIEKTISAYYKQALKKTIGLISKLELSCSLLTQKQLQKNKKKLITSMQYLRTTLASQKSDPSLDFVKNQALNAINILKSVDFGYIFIPSKNSTKLYEETLEILREVLSGNQESLPTLVTAEQLIPAENCLRFLKKVLFLNNNITAISISPNARKQPIILINHKPLNLWQKLWLGLLNKKNYLNLALNLDLELKQKLGIIYPVKLAIKPRKYFKTFILVRN